MTEIRQAKPEELDEMLSVMTTAFGVPKESWAEGFYSFPHDDIRNKQVVIEDGRIVSCLEFIPAEIYLAGTTVRMGGIAGVATLPEHRGRGYAGMLMRDSIHALRELGYQTSGLFPFSYEWYRRYGWEFVSHYLIYTVKPNYLPPYSETQFVRPYEERDLPALMTIYTDRYSNHVGPFVRIEQEWKENIFRRFGEVMVYDGGGVKGYLIGRTKEEDGRHFEIKEIVATSEEARRGLVGWLARLDPELKPIKFLTSEFELRDLELFTPRADWLETYESRCNIRLRPGLMFRIIDLLTAMKRLAQRMSGIPMGLAIHALDELAPWNDDPVLIEGTKMPSVRKGESPFWIKADIRVISQLYIGYMSPREAFSLGKIEVSGPEAVELAEQVFRKSEPFIPEVNEF